MKQIVKPYKRKDGQTVFSIPKLMATEMNIKAGDSIEFFKKNGDWIIRKCKSPKRVVKLSKTKKGDFLFTFPKPLAKNMRVDKGQKIKFTERGGKNILSKEVKKKNDSFRSKNNFMGRRSTKY